MQLSNTMSVRASLDDFQSSVLLYVYDFDGTNRRVYKLSEPQDILGPATYVQPSFFIEKDSAQALMDSLWECGLRPTAGAGSAGQLSATQAHLADQKALSDRLFKIIEHKLGVK